MSKLFVVTNEGTTGDSLFLYDVDAAGALTLLSSARIQTAGSALSTSQVGGRISADGRFAFVSHAELDPGDFVLSVFDLEDGISLVDRGDGADGASTGSDLAISADASVVWHCHFAQWTRLRTFDGETLGAKTGIREGEDSVGCTSDGQLCVGADNADGVLLKNDAGTPALVSTFSTFGTVRTRNIAVSPDDQFVAVRSDSGGEGRVEIYEISDTGLTLLDHGLVDDDDSFVRPLWSADGTKLFMADREFSWDGASLTLENTFTGANWISRTTNGSLIANVESSDLSIKDGASFSELSRTNLGSISWFEFLPELGPTTPEELFQASYADASAAPPKITARIRPADVQRSIDTDVNNLIGGPDFYIVEPIFDIGELANLRQDKLYFVKDDQPGLRDGKLLRLKRYEIRDGDPAVPVTCTLWG